CGNALVATRQYLRDEPATMRRLTRALVTAIARFKRNPGEGAEAINRFLGTDDDQKAAQLWQTLVPRFPERPYPDPRGLQAVLDELAQTDERVRVLPPADVADPSWVGELDQSG